MERTMNFYSLSIKKKETGSRHLILWLLGNPIICENLNKRTGCAGKDVSPHNTQSMINCFIVCSKSCFYSLVNLNNLCFQEKFSSRRSLSH